MYSYYVQPQKCILSYFILFSVLRSSLPGSSGVLRLRVQLIRPDPAFPHTVEPTCGSALDTESFLSGLPTQVCRSALCGSFVYFVCEIESIFTRDSAGFSSEDDAPALKYRKKTCMNQPHLRFEITSDDGFSVKANSIEGRTGSSALLYGLDD